MSDRRFGQQTLPLRTPAVQTDQVRLGPAFTNKSEAGRIDLAGARSPLRPGFLYVGAVLLGSPERLF
jgi:hypothetical protein